VDVSVDVVRVRYRAGLVGEARRVVHLALWHEGFRTLCGREIRCREAEILGVAAGMPCMACARVLALRSRLGGTRGLAREVAAE